MRAYGQRDPLVEYKVEAANMFEGLLASDSARRAHTMFHVRSCASSRGLPSSMTTNREDEATRASQCARARRSGETIRAPAAAARNTRNATGGNGAGMARADGILRGGACATSSGVIVGKRDEVELALIALACQGHLLIEDVPGVGKTVLAKSLARSIGCSFKRIQFTPDLLPSDVTGVSDLQPEDRRVRVSARSGHRPDRAGGRDQPRDPEDPG